MCPISNPLGFPTTPNVFNKMPTMEIHLEKEPGTTMTWNSGSFLAPGIPSNEPESCGVGGVQGQENRSCSFESHIQRMAMQCSSSSSRHLLQQGFTSAEGEVCQEQGLNPPAALSTASLSTVYLSEVPGNQRGALRPVGAKGINSKEY